MVKHCEFMPETISIFNQLAKENQSFMVVMGHFGNWEWGGNTFSISCKHQLYVIYHPLANKYFNGLIISDADPFWYPPDYNEGYIAGYAQKQG